MPLALYPMAEATEPRGADGVTGRTLRGFMKNWLHKRGKESTTPSPAVPVCFTLLVSASLPTSSGRPSETSATRFHKLVSFLFLVPLLPEDLRHGFCAHLSVRLLLCSRSHRWGSAAARFKLRCPQLSRLRASSQAEYLYCASYTSARSVTCLQLRNK